MSRVIDRRLETFTDEQMEIYEKMVEDYSDELSEYEISYLVAYGKHKVIDSDEKVFIEYTVWNLLGPINNGNTIDYLENIHIDWSKFLAKAGVYFIKLDNNKLLQLMRVKEEI